MAVQQAPTAAGRRSVADIARRVPFTVVAVGTMLVLGVLTSSLWQSLQDRSLFQAVAYGLPALEQGRVWTPVTGAFFALVPAQYLPVAGGALVLLGWSEWRLGTRRTVVAAIGCHLVGVLGASLFLLAFRTVGWDWAQRLSKTLDVGLSAGALGAVAAASATLTPPWRGRLRLVLGLYGGIALLYIGLLWDVEHFLAIAFGLALGPFLLGSRPRLRPLRLTRHEWRVVSSTIFVVSAAINAVLYFTPSNGPLGATTDDSDAATVWVNAAISVALAWGLSRGSRRTWQVACGLTTIAVVAGLLVLGLEVAAPDQLDPSGQVVSSVPELAVAALLSLVQLAVLVAGRSAFQARSARHRRATLAAGASDRDTAVALLEQHGGTTTAWMGTWPDNHWHVLRDASGRPAGYVAFQVHRGMAVALGDPVAADPATRAQALQAFVDEQETHGHKVCFFSVSREVAQWGRAHGRRVVPVAEEAVIDLATLEFRGKPWQDVRTALNRATKEGITYREGRLAEMPRGVVTQVRAISELWVSDKGLPEMGFTLGGVDEALDPATVVGLAVDGDHTVHGVTSWLPVHAPGGEIRGWTLDMMRRLPEGFRPVTEFLIASACLSFKEAGASLVSLSGAPLAHSGDGTSERAALERLLDQLGEALEPLYGFRSLESFKRKFQPRHEPLHLVFADEAALPRIGLALTSAYLPGATLRDLARAGLGGDKGSRP
ncbi:bifunctional lysylphosphatidylglycerol flippase/synthetase MprF [Terrabacter sp. 2RAF25]|uniref:bifunctional lysylphosphatidylglycerol flippase/synthetase MprF n=1 Tax=Terrabacter sp. 2RAF25 TaxID=3232998 RepID=UPI003F9D0940